MEFFRDFFAPETLFTVLLTLKYSVLALLLSWGLALAVSRIKSRLLLQLLQVLWVMPGFAYALIVLISLRTLGFQSRYGMFAVVIAWVIAAIPYLSLSFREALKDLDAREREALTTLGANPWQAWFYFDFLRTLRAQASIVLQQFWLYLTSFTLVMILSGGPPNETLEVAIYTSVRLSQVNYVHAWALGLWQLILLLSLRLILRQRIEKTEEWRQEIRQAPPESPLMRFLALALLPGAALVWAFVSKLDLGGFSESLITSVCLALSVSVSTLVLNFILYHSGFRALAEVGAWFSPMLLSLLAWKTLAFRFPAFLICYLIQILLFSPWIARGFYPLLDRARIGESEAARTLGATRWQAWQEIEWNRVRSAAFWMMGFVFSLSMTEVSSVILFSRNNFEPLSVWIQNSFLRFRLSEAALGTACLVFLSFLAVRRKERSA